jgi:putative transcription factor
MEHQDWTPVVCNTTQQQTGPSDSYRKFSKRTYEQAFAGRLDYLGREDEDDAAAIPVKTIPLSLSRSIEHTRCKRMMTREDLANKLGVKKEIIREYETGKAVPTPAMLNKIKRVLNMQ